MKFHVECDITITPVEDVVMPIMPPVVEPVLPSIPIAPIVIAVPPADTDLVQQADLNWVGSFRVPSLLPLQYSMDAMAYDTNDDTLIVSGVDEYKPVLIKLRIPPVDIRSSKFIELDSAVAVGKFVSADNGQRLIGNPDDTSLRGLLVVKNRLLATIASYYDANGVQKTSHFSRSTDLRESTVLGPFALSIADTLDAPVGHVAGHMCRVPEEWQARLGGAVLTGNFGLPIISRESYGPAAFVFEPALVGATVPQSVVPLLDYDGDHPLGPWDGQSDLWNSDSRFSGVTFIQDSVLFWGRHGVGPFKYGAGSKVGDPENDNQGSHTYPYVYRIWAYDAHDLERVKLGTLKPWEPRPYGVWNLTLPMTATNYTKLCSVAHDVEGGRIFVAQGFGADDPSNGFPIVHVYRVGG